MNLQEQISRIKSMMGINEQVKNPLDFLKDKSYMDFKNFNYNPQEKNNNEPNKLLGKDISGYDLSTVTTKKPEIGVYPSLFMYKAGRDYMRKEEELTAILYKGFVYSMVMDALGDSMIYKFNKNDFEKSLKEDIDTPNPVDRIIENDEKNKEKFNEIKSLIDDASKTLKYNVVFDPKTTPKLKLSSMFGKVFILDFWATWCGPCRVKLKNHLNPLNQEFGSKGLDFFFYSVDDNINNLKSYVDTNIKYGTHVFDPKGFNSEALKTFNVNGLPATFLFDSKGNSIKLPTVLEETKSLINSYLEKK